MTYIKSLLTKSLPVRVGSGGNPIPFSDASLVYPAKLLPNTVDEWNLGVSSASFVGLNGAMTLIPGGGTPTFDAISATPAVAGRFGFKSATVEQLGQTVMLIAAYNVPAPEFGAWLEGTQLSSQAAGGHFSMIYGGNGSLPAGLYANVIAADPVSGVGVRPNSQLLNAPARLVAGDLFFFGLTYDASGWEAFVGGRGEGLKTAKPAVLLPNTSAQPIALGNASWNVATYFNYMPRVVWATIINQRLTTGEMASVYRQKRMQTTTRGGTLT
ncbi:MAG TPA: hypothetical protein VGF56_05705 [Rhizomicrobium sp.]|jgi:hypothetical protein